MRDQEADADDESDPTETEEEENEDDEFKKDACGAYVFESEVESVEV